MKKVVLDDKILLLKEMIAYLNPIVDNTSELRDFLVKALGRIEQNLKNKDTKTLLCESTKTNQIKIMLNTQFNSIIDRISSSMVDTHILMENMELQFHDLNKLVNSHPEDK